MKTNLSEINLDFNEAWQWSRFVQNSVILSICVCIFVAGIFFDTLSQLDKLFVLKQKENELRTTFASLHEQPVNLFAYQEQLDELQKKVEFHAKEMLDDKDASAVLTDISHLATKNTLELKLFKPKESITKSFYIENPISITVAGTYNQILQFISELSALPSIVTIHDLVIATSDKSLMTMSATIKTYSETN